MRLEASSYHLVVCSEICCVLMFVADYYIHSNLGRRMRCSPTRKYFKTGKNFNCSVDWICFAKDRLKRGTILGMKRGVYVMLYYVCTVRILYNISTV